jgi:hypothetical protein
MRKSDMTSWARQRATGAAVSGSLKGAVYDTRYGTLWFECAGTRFCAVRMRTASNVGREDTARRLAQLVDGRLR